jgi:hypothetical protein
VSEVPKTGLAPRFLSCQKIVNDCNNIGKISLYFIFWYTVNKTSALWDHHDLCIFKLNFTILLVVFYASIKKQSYRILRQIYDTFWCVLQQSLRSEIVCVFYTKFRTHLRCFSSRFTLKSFEPEPAHYRLHAIFHAVILGLV